MAIFMGMDYMKFALQFSLIFGILLVSHFFTANFTYTIVGKLKSGDYSVTALGYHIYTFQSWFWFVFWFLAMIQPFYWIGGIMIMTAYKYSFIYFHAAYLAVLANLITIILNTVFFMRLRVGEVPNRNGWIALIFILIASIFAALSKK